MRNDIGKFKKYHCFSRCKKNRGMFIVQEFVIIATLKEPDDYVLLLSCCQAARKCCNLISTPSIPEFSNQNKSRNNTCPATWDGWQCWMDDTPVGSIAEHYCPQYIYFLTHAGHNGVGCQGMAQKSCTNSGWYQVSSGAEWTDFSGCDKTDDTIKMEYIRLSLYAVSSISLLPAILIFHIYRMLQVTRISIHKHLFLSLFLFTLTTGIFRAQVLLPHLELRTRNSFIHENAQWCRLLIIMSKYFRLTNYAWMWNEGFYLHRLLSNTFEEHQKLGFLLIFGWGLPLFPTMVYALLRSYYQDEMCWAQPSEEGWVEWITYLPGLLCIAGNIFFFLNIFYILITKLRAPHANEPTNFRKAVRACSVLVPLFGLQWLLTFYRFNSGSCYLLAAYKYTDLLLDSLQGFVVAVTFCYRNGEIIVLMRRSYSVWRSSRQVRRGTRKFTKTSMELENRTSLQN